MNIKQQPETEKKLKLQLKKQAIANLTLNEKQMERLFGGFAKTFDSCKIDDNTGCTGRTATNNTL